MRPSTLLSTLFLVLRSPALIATIYLYFYPVFHRCDFPTTATCPSGDCTAPFRLLTLGDPQLEGDTSLPDPNAPLFPSWVRIEETAKLGHWLGFRDALEDLVKKDVVNLLQTYRKKLDLWGNDLYLAHIYRTVSWWTQPTHTVVLGDLLGSQWIGDEEFRRRTERFWDRVFAGAEKVPGRVTDVEGATEVLGQDEGWENRIIAVVGNHDIGYAGDINEHRIERFEEAYGPVNWDIRFRLANNTSTGNTTDLGDMAPELHLIILNSMNLDDPAYDTTMQTASRDFIDKHLHNPEQPPPHTTATILLTHIPFHKQPGICVDAPFFSYFPDDQGGGIREQNHLSKHVSGHILNGLVRDGGGQAIVLNGHDHEGCDTFHYREREREGREGTKKSWDAKHYATSAPERVGDDVQGLREITVRSMMGSFGGNAGLLSAWFDYDTREWKFEYDTCALGVQHIWWAIHVLDFIVVGLGVGWMLAVLVEMALMKSRLSGLAGGGKVKQA